MVKYFKYWYLFSILLLVFPHITLAERQNVTDWYIKDFKSEITLNKDNSIDVVENIVADCGNCVDRHGIFRILPTSYQVGDKKYKAPIKLKSITDFDNKSLKYKESNNYSDNTVTWKIGDSNINVSGINNYRISYNVKNPVRQSGELDEFYWNLSGNYWQLEIDHFEAIINLPDSINQGNSKISLYGNRVNTQGSGTQYSWIDKNTLKIENNNTLRIGEGVTVSLAFPQSIIAAYNVPFDYWLVFFILIPIMVLLGCFIIWNRYGKDPHLHRTIVPEFAVPDNLSPLKMSAILSQGNFGNSAVAASIITLAVKGIITIEESQSKGILGLGKNKEYTFKRTQKSDTSLSAEEKDFLEHFMGNKDTKTLQQIKDGLFFEKIIEMKKNLKDRLYNEGIFGRNGFTYQVIFLVLGALVFFGGFMLLFFSDTFQMFIGLGIAFIVSGVIIFCFGIIMPSYTISGENLRLKIKGFELYMKTAEKYRQQFNEKENIFETLLPYAILFGLTKHWIKVAKEFKGAEYIDNFHPIWYVGGVGTNFDLNGVASQISSISNQISSAPSSSSGIGGGGFSGGGGGGGGGGGW